MLYRVTAVALLAATSTAAYAQDIPPGPGSDIVARACSVCHGLDVVAGQHHDLNGWHAVVDTMISNGAAVTPQEEDRIVDYLAKAFPQ